MFGKIGIKNLRIYCIIGCLSQERTVKQNLFIDLECKYNFSTCVLSDDCKDTIDYVALANLCTEIALVKPYHLLESLAHAILEVLMTKFDMEWVSIRIKKPEAIPQADYAFIELEKFKEQ